LAQTLSVLRLEVSGFSQCLQKPLRHFSACWAIGVTKDSTLSEWPFPPAVWPQTGFKLLA
jgi:hypothetical protein